MAKACALSSPPSARIFVSKSETVSSRSKESRPEVANRTPRSNSLALPMIASVSSVSSSVSVMPPHPSSPTQPFGASTSEGKACFM